MKLLLEKSLPTVGIGLVVHPETHIEQDYCSHKGCDAFGHLTSRRSAP